MLEFRKLFPSKLVPCITRIDYQLIDISKDGFVSLLTENGYTKDDLWLPTDENLLSQRKSKRNIITPRRQNILHRLEELSAT
ncbi:hypothetical protein LguiA_000410 [Lonicera macranthoides]